MVTERINPHLLSKELLENRSKYLLCTLVLGLLAIASVIFFPGNGSHVLTVSFNHYIWSHWSAGLLPQLGAAVAIVMGMGSFSLERARGTILFLFNTPLSRDTIFRTKTVAALLLLCCTLIASAFLVILSSRLLGYHIASGPFMAVLMLTLMGLIFVFQLTVLFSVLTTDPVKAGTISAFCCFILYGFGLFNETHFISPFYYMGGADYLHGASYPWIFLPVMLLLSIALYILAQHFWRNLEV